MKALQTLYPSHTGATALVLSGVALPEGLPLLGTWNSVLVSLQDVIVWSGKVGVNSSNGANRLEGVHTWNLAGHAGGVGILLHTGSGAMCA